MRDIEELINNSKKYNKAVLQQKLKSKKNTVAYVTLDNKPRVLKWFVPGLKNQMKVEYNILKKGSSKLNIPQVFELDENNNVILTNYLIGENLFDLINDENITFNEKKRLLILLSDWFFEFHNFFKNQDEFIIRGDSNLKNFIFTDKIWGVDFEEARKGKPVEDLSETCASILLTNPMFTKEKFQLCQLFLESYSKKAPGRIINHNSEIAFKLLEKIQFRPNDEEIIRRYSNRIRKQGL